MKTETPTTETKTQPPVNGEAKASDVKNPFAAFDPMAYWAQSQQMFRDAMTEAQKTATSFASHYSALDPGAYWTSFRDTMTTANARAHAAADQYAVLETQLIDRAQAAVATWAQLAHDAIGYGAQLSVQARKLGIDAARKMGASA